MCREVRKEGKMKTSAEIALVLQSYRKDYDQFRKKLVLFALFTAGLPHRGTELAFLRCANTQQTLRNFFISHGRVVFIITTYKNPMR
jgi:hypothetical protein